MKTETRTVAAALENIVQQYLKGATLGHISHVGFNLKRMSGALSGYSRGIVENSICKGQNWRSFRSEIESRYSLKSIPSVFFRRLERIDDLLQDLAVLDLEHLTVDLDPICDIGLLTDTAKAIARAVMQMPDIRGKLPIVVLPNLEPLNWIN